jgi:Zn-dependent alcohol dehydrogenase
MGHESAGLVEETGAEVGAVKPGDHVVTCKSVFCGHCEYCLSGRPALCTKVGLDRDPGDPPGRSWARIASGDIPRFVDFVRDGRLKLDAFVLARIGLDGIPVALEGFGAAGTVRTVIDFA